MKKRSSDSEQSVTKLVSREDRSLVLVVKRAILDVVEGPDRDKKKEICHPGMVIGTAAECDWALKDPSVSRRHFEIHPVENGYLLKDLGSKNGTAVGGLLVQAAILQGGEEIRAGETVLRFTVLDTEEEIPLSSATAFGGLLGRSLAMRQVFAVLEVAAGSEATVLIEGESGTGKDLAAEALHQASPRGQGPFVVVDCGTIRPELVESELFGHAKGAFTGANSERAGVFESGNGGTVFLDEIGELPGPLQVALLRLLEKKEIRRLGENRYRSVDVRLVAATNRDLSADVEAGRFRQDLYYRLSVVKVRMPPLRERREDIGLLARGLVQKFRADLNPAEVINDRVLAMLANHDWPGNVRELRNVVERLILFPGTPPARLTTQSEKSAQTLTGDLMRLPFNQARALLNERFEKLYLSELLAEAKGVVALAAEKAQIPRQSFYRLMTKHRLTNK